MKKTTAIDMLKEQIINQPLQILWINALNILTKQEAHRKFWAPTVRVNY